ncbi:MAG: hypothetical protein LBV49_10265 [Azonexus sp.]|jgi:hypothetical protein|nr:hypothetical protein [Azonexus sp.]
MNAQRQTSPSVTPTAFECKYPYRISEEGVDKLTQADGLLMTLAMLAGEITNTNKHAAIPFSMTDLERSVWGIFCLINDALKTLVNDHGESAEVICPAGSISLLPRPDLYQ